MRYTTSRWVDPLLDTAMSEVGLEKTKTYILFYQNTDAQYIATRQILELCLAAAQRPGVRVTRCWWVQASLNFGKE